MYSNNYNKNIINQIIYVFKQKNILSTLILTNIAIFLVINVIKVCLFLLKKDYYFDELIKVLAVPANTNALLLKPWTIITYMFTHIDFFHIFFNMIILYFAGRMFLQYFSTNKFIKVYLLGGLCGAFLFILFYNLFPVFYDNLNVAVAIGASASILAILTAIATYIPNFSVNLLLIGKIKLKYLVLIIILIDLISINKSNSGGHIAHIGGAMAGYLYIIVNKLPLKIMAFNIFKKPTKKYYSQYSNNVRYMSDEEYNEMKTARQKKIDRILEKISQSGYQSLTKEEKEFLFNYSKKD